MSKTGVYLATAIDMEIGSTKRMAEGAPSVGEFTSMTIIEQDGTEKKLTTDVRVWLEEMYRQYSPKEIPPQMPGFQPDKMLS